MRRALLIAIAVILCVPMLAAAAVWVWLDPAVVKARLQDETLAATGRPLTIDGPVTLLWGLTPRLRVEGMRLANPPGLSRPDMATVQSAELGVAILPLLSGRAELRVVRLHGVNVLLERDSAGVGNWERPAPAATTGPATTGPAPPSPATPSPAQRRMAVTLGAATLTDAMLGWRDAGRTTMAQVPRLVFQDGALNGTITLAGVTIKLSGTTAPLHLEAETGEVALRGMVLTHPVLLLSQAGDSVTLAGIGMLGTAATQIDVKASSLAAALRGELERAQITIGEARLTAAGRFTPGAVDATVVATVPDLAALSQVAGVTLPALRTLSADGRVQTAGAGLHVTGMARAGTSAAVLDLLLAARSVRGTVSADRIDLDEWATAAASQTPPPPPAPASPAPVPAASVPPAAIPPAATQPAAIALASPRPIPWAALTAGEGDVALTVGTLRWHGTDVTAVNAHAVLAAGHLVLEPAHALLGGAPADARLVADAPSQRLSVTVLAPGLPAAAVLALAGLPPMVSGPAELDLDLTGTGADGPALLASLTGRLGLAMVGGDADLALIPGLAQATRDLPMAAAGRTRLRCVALRTDSAAGQATLAALLLDSPRLTLTGEGSVSLANRTLALQLRPVVGIGSARVAVPVRVTGPWAAPALRMEGDGGRAQVTIGDAGADSCAPALLLARNGRAGPGPSQDAPKPPRPADLLRSLLR